MGGSRIVLLVALVLTGVASAAAPREVRYALDVWTFAVKAGSTDDVVALMAPGDELEITIGLAAPVRLSADALRARLAAGEGNQLGLARGLNLPKARHLRQRGRFYVGAATDCPEVEWTFERVRGHAGQRARVRLVRIRRVFLEC